jgi:hypothetical protein
MARVAGEQEDAGGRGERGGIGKDFLWLYL